MRRTATPYKDVIYSSRVWDSLSADIGTGTDEEVVEAAMRSFSRTLLDTPRPNTFNTDPASISLKSDRLARMNVVVTGRHCEQLRWKEMGLA